MTSKIECVVKQAVITFSDSLKSSDFHDNLVELKQNANELDSQSVGLDLRLLQWDVYELKKRLDQLPKPLFARNCQTPVTYILVYENKNVSIGLFVLRNGSKIPFHDHPNMHGLLKVIYGKVKIQSYTAKEMDYENLEVGSSINAEKMASVIIGIKNDSVILYPKEGNIHQVSSVDGPAVVLDILSPPYGTESSVTRKRYCTYFKKGKKFSGTKLTIVPEPTVYWCDLSPYTGPQLGKSND